MHAGRGACVVQRQDQVEYRGEAGRPRRRPRAKDGRPHQRLRYERDVYKRQASTCRNLRSKRRVRPPIPNRASTGCPVAGAMRTSFGTVSCTPLPSASARASFWRRATSATTKSCAGRTTSSCACLLYTSCSWLPPSASPVRFRMFHVKHLYSCLTKHAKRFSMAKNLRIRKFESLIAAMRGYPLCKIPGREPASSITLDLPPNRTALTFRIRLLFAN